MRQFLHCILTFTGYALTLIGALLLVFWAICSMRPMLHSDVERVWSGDAMRV